ncbi:MAG: hypothetical protein LBI86_09505 [Treponema sp.]|jgi:hypothetical protein|nr:hypothetical protein [Treponema sp.]
MRNLIFIVVIVIYAVVYILRLARKPAPPPRPVPRQDLFADEDDDEDDIQDLPSARLAPAPEEAYMPPLREVNNIPAARTANQADVARLDSFNAAILPASAGKNAGPASGERIFQQLEKMPPLARAIALSEILGPPKGIAP